MCVWVTGQTGRDGGVLRMVGMDEECQKAKEGEIMKTTVKKSFYPQNEDGEEPGPCTVHTNTDHSNMFGEKHQVLQKGGLKQSHNASPQEL